MSSVSNQKTSLHMLNEWIQELEAIVAVASTSSSTGHQSVSEHVAPLNPQSKKKENNKAPKTEKQAIPTATVSDGKDAPLTINSIDLRVGIIKKVSRHETADKLYCEEIDVGEAEPRIIASGLVPHYTLEEMQNRRLIVVCNLAPRKLVGFKSHGMVLCAVKVDATSGAEKVELLDPPSDAQPGDRVFSKDFSGEPLSVKQCDKRKAFETVAPGLIVNSDGVAMWNGSALVTNSGGVCRAPTIRDGILR